MTTPGRTHPPFALALACLLLAVLAPSGAAAATPHAGQQIDMKVLLLSADGREPDFAAWKTLLAREGVPFDTIVGTRDPDITSAKLAVGERARYQGVVVASADGTTAGGRPVSWESGSGVIAFSEAEWTALKNFERRFAVRHLISDAYPGPSVGMNHPEAWGPLDGTTASLNAPGLQAFPYLAGPVAFDTGTYNEFAAPCTAIDPACPSMSFTPLLQTGGATLLGTAVTKDDREEMVATFNQNEHQMQAQLLGHGMLNWVTRGVFLGRNRAYLAVHVDDVFLPDDKWDPVSNTTPEDTAPGQQDLRMTAADVTRLVAWQNANAFKLDMVFNAGGSVEAGGDKEPLTKAFLAQKAQFPWINHTFDHANIDGPPPAPALTEAQIVATIKDNQDWAGKKGLPNYDSSELVTGEHSGVGTTNPPKPPNPNLAQALAKTKIKAIASDNSRETGQRAIGQALTFPRHPMNVFYNVATFDDALDEYDWLYLDSNHPSGRGNCANTATTTCFSEPTTREQLVDREAGGVLRHMLANDPRPHYAHQSNLIGDPTDPDVANRGDGILLKVVSEALRLHRGYVTAGFERPTPTQSTEQLRREAAWRAALAAGRVTASIQDGAVTISTTSGSPVFVPLTGTAGGDLYGGQVSGWLSVDGGKTVVRALADPDNTKVPEISGKNHPGDTVTATTGTWKGTPAIVYAKQWQRRTSEETLIEIRGVLERIAPWTWFDIPGATQDSYTLTSDDVGQVRVVVTAANAISSWSMAISKAFDVKR